MIQLWRQDPWGGNQLVDVPGSFFGEKQKLLAMTLVLDRIIKSMTTLILITDWVEKLIMAGLIGLSILSISLIIERGRVLKQEIDLGFFAELREYLEKNQFAEFNARLVQKKGLLAGALARAYENSQSVQSIDRWWLALLPPKK